VKSRTANYFASIAVLVLISALAACSHFQGGSTTEAARGTYGLSPAPLPENTTPTAPLGQVAGDPAHAVTALSTANPFQNDPQAIEQGKQLYRKMNCAGCHAYTGKGNMGPDLTDTYWRYGGLPIQIYETIRDGRPQGMPAWGAALPPEEIWKLVAYIQSFGGTVAVADYEHARQGDRPGQQVAPEAQADAMLAPAPPNSTGHQPPLAPAKASEAKP
jgi:cytochrome c oxidase cbb3-type subunit 3